MSFYEVQIRYGFPENLVIDTNLAGALWWLEQLTETVGEDQEVGFWKNVEVPGSGVAKILSEAGDWSRTCLQQAFPIVLWNRNRPV